MHPSFLGKVFKLGRRTSDVLGVSEAIGTVLLLGISVTLAGAIALWTQTIDEGEQGIYVDLWANIQGNDVLLTHRGGDFLDGANSYIHIRNSDGTTATRNTYTVLSGGTDVLWGPGETVTIDLTGVSDSFDVIVTTIKGNGNPTVIMSATMLKSGVGGALPDLAVTMIQIRDTNDVVIASGIYEEGPYQIFINVSNFGSDLPAPYFIDEHVTHTVSNLQIFHTADDLQISSVDMSHMRPGTPPTEIVGADRGKLENGDYIEVVYMWNAFQSDPRTLGTHSLNVKVMPHPDGEINYRNNYVDRKVKVNKEITPMIIDGPDPGIYSISFSEGSPQSGDTVTVTVIIQNSGDQAITAAHNVHMVVSTWAPQRMEGTNYDMGFDYTGQYYIKESFDWKMDSPPGHHGDWRSQITDGSQPMVYDDEFPTCVVPNIVLLPGAYFFYYFNLEARVDVPGGEQRVYVAIDVFDHLARPQGITAMQGDDTKDNQGIGTIQVLPRILLVDDDEAQMGTAGDMTSSVIEALIGSGVTVDKVYVAQEVEDSGNTRDAPAYDYVQAEIPAPAMEDYDIVIWVTGYVEDPFTNRPAPALHGGNIQEMMKYMDSNKYLFIVGESPLKGLTTMFSGGNNPLSPQAPYAAGQPVFEDGKTFVYDYLGISWIENDMDLPLAGEVIRGLDTGVGGITPIAPSKTQYDIELKDLAAGNQGMQLFKLRDADVAGFERAIGVTTTEAEITASSGKFNMLRITSTPSGVHNSQYRTAIAAWDINQIEFLNEKINLFSGVLNWFDWKINVGRDLAVTRMQLFILTESSPGTWTQELISPTNLPKYLDTVYIEATVRNNGPSVESTSLMFYVTGPDGIELPIAANQYDPRTTPAVRETFGNPQDISSIAGGGEEIVRYKLWLAVGVGQYTFRVVVDPYHLITEVSEENNDITYSTSTVTSFVTQNNILIVDDDFSDNNFDDHADTTANKGPLTIDYTPQGGSPADKIHQTLLDLGYDHEVHVVKNSYETGSWVFDSGLGILDIKRYNSIIWVFGDSGDRVGATQRETLTDKDLDAMMTYLDGKYNEAVFLPETHTENIAFIGFNFVEDLYNFRADIVAPSTTVTVEQFASDFLGIDVSGSSSVRTGIAAGGVPDGDFINDIYTGIEYYSPLHMAPFLFRELTITPVAESDQRINFGAVEQFTNDVYLTGAQLYRTAEGKYSKTIVHSWQLNMLSNVDIVPATSDKESPLHEMTYLTLHWFNTPESRPELISRNSKIKFDNDNPVLGNSYLVEIQIANVGGVAGGGTVRFTDGSTLIKSENIYMDPNKVTTLEAIWTPLYAGMRTLMVWIDRYDNYDEVFDVINNKPYQTREIYFFWDDMEGGLGNWNHDATVQLINGEGKLDYMEEPTTSHIVNEWGEISGFHNNNAVDNSLVAREFYSSNVSFMMHEPSAEVRSPVDVVLVIDTSGSMSGSKIQSARTAAKTFVDQMGEYDRVALYRFTSSEDPWRVQDLTYMTAANKVSTKSTIDGFPANSWTPIWDTIGDAIQYSISNGQPGRTPAVVAMTDGDDWGTNGRETGSERYAPGSDAGLSHADTTWGRRDMSGLRWGDPQKQYLDEWGVAGRDIYRRTSTSGGSYVNLNSVHDMRTGLINAPVYVFTIGLGISPRDTTYVNGGSTPPSQSWSPHTTEYDLWQIAHKSSYNSIGRGKYYYAPTANELQTIYDDIFVEIQNLAQQATRADTRAGEVLYYKLDEAFGATVAADASGFGHNGNVLRSDQWVTTGVISGAIDMNANNEIKIPSSLQLDNLNMQTRSISFWIKADDTVNRQVIYRQGGTTNGLTIYLYNNRLYARWVSSFSANSELSMPYSDTSNWHLITFMFDGNGLAQTLYIDAVPVDSQNYGGYIASDTSGIFMGASGGLWTSYHDGSSNWNYRLDGSLDDFRIFNYRLTDNDVTDLYESALRDRNGLRAEYYTWSGSAGFQNFELVRVEPNVNYNWGTGSVGGVQNDRVAVRWTGYVLPLYAETYTFYTRTDDGVRLYVNDVRIINDWRDKSPNEVSGSISLQGNVLYKIVMEYYENGGGAVAELSWSSSSQPKQIIPPERLFLSKYTSSGGGGGGSGGGGGAPEIDPNNPWTDGSVVNTNKWLLTKPLDLRNVDNATLTFYHKYNLKVGANGGVIQIGIADDDAFPEGSYRYLYIQPDQPYTGNTLTSSWVTNLDDFGVPMRWCWNGKSAGGTMGWEFISVNLNDFVGHYIRIKFLYVYNYGGSGYGWIIDDVMLKTSTDVDNTGKDDSLDNWNHVSTLDKNNAPTMAWYCGDPSLGGDLKDGVDNSLYTRPIDLTNARTAHLYAEFKFNIQTASGRPPDGFRVEISKDNGVSWVPLSLGVRTSWGVSGTENDASDGVPGDGKSFTGLPLGNYWVASHSLARLITNLDGFIGNTVILRFRVVTNIDGQHFEDPGLFKGIYMDNVVLFGESLEGSRTDDEETLPVMTPLTEPILEEHKDGIDPPAAEIEEQFAIGDPARVGSGYALLLLLLLMVPALMGAVIIRRRT
ncbi:MAG: PA14 domain-containing protein [Candidatus Thermoplasmatota archaeon]|nr:PA14 domain-containing protein [Candidatus Thermoplasmatota archaeon]